MKAADDPAQELIVANCTSASEGRRAWWWFVEDIDVDLPEPSLQTEVRRSEHGCNVVVIAEALVKDLVLSVDRLDLAATVSDQLITLLPGESYTFSVTSSADLDPASLTSPPVLMSVNHLEHLRSGGVRA